MNLNLNKTPAAIQSNSLLKRSFLLAGILFAIVCIIGFITKAIIDRTGALSDYYASTSSSWDTSFLTQSDESFKVVKIIFGFGGVCIIASAICSLVWVFRISKASKTFIVVNYTLFALAQGIGFGSLFIVFQATELLAIFGIAGGIFLAMGAIGFLIKDGTKLLPFILIGFAVSVVLSLISTIMYFTNVYSDNLILFITIFTGFMTCIYIMFDVWYIRRSGQFYEMQSINDSDMAFRLAAFFGFRLASDLVSLVWTVARLYLRSRR